jgi:hypothetical protein
MILIFIGILLGWLIPRPKIVGDWEVKLLGSLKQRVPEKYRWW